MFAFTHGITKDNCNAAIRTAKASLEINGYLTTGLHIPSAEKVEYIEDLLTSLAELPWESSGSMTRREIYRPGDKPWIYAKFYYDKMLLQYEQLGGDPLLGALVLSVIANRPTPKHITVTFGPYNINQS